MTPLQILVAFAVWAALIGGARLWVEGRLRFWKEQALLARVSVLLAPSSDWTEETAEQWVRFAYWDHFAAQTRLRKGTLYGDGYVSKEARGDAKEATRFLVFMIQAALRIPEREVGEEEIQNLVSRAFFEYPEGVTEEV